MTGTVAHDPAWQDAVERAKAVTIDSIITARGIKLRRQGAELVGPCPVCGGTDRFGVHLHKQLFNCRGCGMRGRDAIALVQQLDNSNFAAAIETMTGVASPQRAKGEPLD